MTANGNQQLRKKPRWLAWAVSVGELILLLGFAFALSRYWLMLPVWAWLRNERNARNTNKNRALPLSILHPLHVFLGTDRKMRAVQERWPELRDQGAGIGDLGLGTENSVQSPDHCSMARCSCSCHCLSNEPMARSPDHPMTDAAVWPFFVSPCLCGQ